jgi:hypothetical protein
MEVAAPTRTALNLGNRDRRTRFVVGFWPFPPDNLPRQGKLPIRLILTILTIQLNKNLPIAR